MCQIQFKGGVGEKASDGFKGWGPEIGADPGREVKRAASPESTTVLVARQPAKQPAAAGQPEKPAGTSSGEI